MLSSAVAVCLASWSEDGDIFSPKWPVIFLGASDKFSFFFSSKLLEI